MSGRLVTLLCTAVIIISLAVITEVIIGSDRVYRYIAPEHAVKVKQK